MSWRRQRRGDERDASHAGDWYSDDAETLNNQLSTWLERVDATATDSPFPIAGCKAIIAPHAGYAYSGQAAAWAYKCIDTSGIKRIFILGPSHHFYLDGCALSACKQYTTPIGNLQLDLETIDELKATGNFKVMDIDADEAEHSIEMHLPYVRKVFQGQDIRIVPIVVGAISHSTEADMGSLLAPYLAKEDTLFVISSDFCHWGARFSYTFYYSEPAPSSTAIRLSRSIQPSPSHPIYQSIRRLDQEAIGFLTIPPSTAQLAHTQFSTYLSQTKNTICGRHPIGVLLGALCTLEKQKNMDLTLQFVRYEQSSTCLSVKDSSVSYASAYVRF